MKRIKDKDRRRERRCFLNSARDAGTREMCTGAGHGVMCSLACAQGASEHSWVSRAMQRGALCTTARGDRKRRDTCSSCTGEKEATCCLRNLQRSARLFVCLLRQSASYTSQRPTSKHHTAPSHWTYSSSPRWPWPGSPPRSRLETSPPGHGRCPPRTPPLRCSELEEREVKEEQRHLIWRPHLNSDEFNIEVKVWSLMVTMSVHRGVKRVFNHVQPQIIMERKGQTYRCSGLITNHLVSEWVSSGSC